LGVLPALGITGVDLRQVQPAAEYRSDVALAMSGGTRLFHVALHAGVALEVAVHVRLSFAALDTESTCEPERRHAVDQAEVDRLRGASLVGRHVGQLHAE